jgi:phage baseplate assembly protein W
MTGYAAVPFFVAATGQTATVPDDVYLAQLLAQIVFVEPGERVNRPDFGCNLRGLTFAPGPNGLVGGELVGAIGTLVQAALRQWVGGTIEVLDVEMRMAEACATATITYRDTRTGRNRRVVVSGRGASG